MKWSKSTIQWWTAATFRTPARKSISSFGPANIGFSTSFMRNTRLDLETIPCFRILDQSWTCRPYVTKLCLLVDAAEVVLRRIDLVLRQIGRTTQNRSRTSSNRRITQNRSSTCQFDNRVLLAEWCNLPHNAQNTPNVVKNDTRRAHIRRTRVQAPRVTFLATYDLSTASPRS